MSLYFSNSANARIRGYCPWGLEIYLPSMLSEEQKQSLAEREAMAAEPSIAEPTPDPLGVPAPRPEAERPETERRASETNHIASDHDHDHASEEGRKGGPSLLDLPAEVRLQIYSWLHLMSPVQHAQLAPWYPTPIYSAYFLKAVLPTLGQYDEQMEEEIRASGRTTPLTERDDKKPSSGRSSPDEQPPQDPEVGKVDERDVKAESPKLLSPHRPLGGIPSAFQRTCRQLYHESRTLPWEENEFVFVNWFSSGIWAARAFTKTLRPWQGASMRHARLELLARDFAPGSSGIKEWTALCDVWAQGIVSLRLKILVGGSIFGPDAPHGETPLPEREAMDLFDGADKAWVVDGLQKLRRLRALEVELIVAEWRNEKKIAWARLLEAQLNAARAPGEELARVLCVEKEIGRREPEHGNASAKFA